MRSTKQLLMNANVLGYVLIIYGLKLKDEQRRQKTLR